MSVKTIMFEIEGLIKNAVMSCASMYGFSAEEALAKIDSNGNLIKPVVDKEAEKAEKQRVKDAEKVEKQRVKDAEKQQKEAVKQQKEAGKALIKQLKETLVKQQKAEIASMKEEDILSKAAEKLVLKQKKEGEKMKLKEPEKKTKKNKKVAVIETSPVIKADSGDEVPFIRFQNIPLMNEINSICDVKKFKNHKKLSVGVKLARQILDI
jgi:hypothetical protein